MISVADAAVVTIGAAGDKIESRTAIQKLIYFENSMNLVSVNYRPHYYGPYSSEVASILQELTALGFVNEDIETKETTGYHVPTEWKRYCYSLPPDGENFMKFVIKKYPGECSQIKDLVQRCKDKSKLDSKFLSWAAKVHYILVTNGSEMVSGEIKSTAKTFNWELSDEQVEKAIDLLTTFDLVKKA